MIWPVGCRGDAARHRRPGDGQEAGNADRPGYEEGLPKRPAGSRLETCRFLQVIRRLARCRPRRGPTDDTRQSDVL